MGAIKSLVRKYKPTHKDHEHFNEIAFTHFYRTHNQHIRNVLFRLGVEDELDDLVQTTFIKAWKNIDQIIQSEHIKSWLSKIAVHSAYDFFRKNKKFKLVDCEPEMLEKPSRPNRDDKDLALEALNKLSFDHRTVIVLCFIEEYTLQETAEILELPIGTVKSRLARAKHAIQTYLEDMGVTL